MSKVLITHNDFDGVTCAILFKVVCPDGMYYLENYDSVDERIKKVLAEEPDFLHITDISPQSKNIIGLINQSGKVRLFDHHETALYLNNFPWATVDTSKCGAYLFCEYLLTFPGLEFLTEWFDLTVHANDYDLWIHSNPHSAVLNSLLYILGHERFINRFIQNPSVSLTEAEKYLLEIENEKEEKYIKEAVKTAKVYDSFAIVFAEKLASQIGREMLETYPVDIAVIVNAQNGTISLRSKKTNVAVLAEALGGGGHPNAAGFIFSRHLFWDIISNLIIGVLSKKEVMPS